MRIALVGVTGLVGQKMLQVLEQRNFPLDVLYPVASESSVGKKIIFSKKQYKILPIQEAIENKPDIALFSAGSDVSIKYAPLFAEKGSIVIDNSSAWRKEPTKKLIVPEINGGDLRPEDRIIANPNCSTIQLLIALHPLHQRYQAKRVLISTFQSVSGSGKKSIDQLFNERVGVKSTSTYPHPIDLNLLPHIGNFTENGYTEEELKLEFETKKILNCPEIEVNATCVRVPVIGGHSEAVNVEFEHPFKIEEIFDLLKNAPSVIVQDQCQSNVYPMPIFAQEKDEVFVGRIRKDTTQPNTLNLWIVSDNLRKGAATNAIQIAEYMIENNLIY